MKLSQLAHEYILSASQLKERVKQLRQFQKGCPLHSSEYKTIQHRIYYLHSEYYDLLKTAKHLDNYDSVKMAVTAI